MTDWMNLPLRDRLMAIMDGEANEIAATIREAIGALDRADAAVLAEREECAAIALSRADIQRIRARVEGNDYAAERAVEADAIAAAIRARV